MLHLNACDPFKFEAPPPSSAEPRHHKSQTNMAARCTCTVFLTVLALFSALVVTFYGAGSGVTCPAVSLALVTGLLSLWLWSLRRRDGGFDRRVCVLVLGDIGRSPRMQYHALSLSKHRYNVTFVGFLGKNDTKSELHTVIHTLLRLPGPLNLTWCCSRWDKLYWQQCDSSKNGSSFTSHFKIKWIKQDSLRVSMYAVRSKTLLALWEVELQQSITAHWWVVNYKINQNYLGIFKK